MTFAEATNELLESGISLNEIAEALGASYAAVKQARLDPSTASYRKPPEGWGAPLVDLARRKRLGLTQFEQTYLEGERLQIDEMASHIDAYLKHRPRRSTIAVHFDLVSRLTERQIESLRNRYRGRWPTVTIANVEQFWGWEDEPRHGGFVVFMS